MDSITPDGCKDNDRSSIFITGPADPYDETLNNERASLIDWITESNDYYGLTLNISSKTDVQKQTMQGKYLGETFIEQTFPVFTNSIAEDHTFDIILCWIEEPT